MTEWMEIEAQIKSLKERQRTLEIVEEPRHKKFLEERRALREKIKNSQDENFLLEILTSQTIVGTPKYSFYEFQIISDKENLSDRLLEELLKHGYLLQRLIFNRGLSFEKRCLALKSYIEYSESPNCHTQSKVFKTGQDKEVLNDKCQNLIPTS